MPNTRTNELKNKIIKMQEETLQDTRKLLDQTLAFNDYAMRQQHRYDELLREHRLVKFRLKQYKKHFGEFEPSDNDKEGNFYGKPKN